MKANAFVELDLHQILSSQRGTQPQFHFARIFVQNRLRREKDWSGVILTFLCFIHKGFLYFLLRTTAAPSPASTARTGAGDAGVSGSSTGSFAGSSS